MYRGVGAAFAAALALLAAVPAQASAGALYGSPRWANGGQSASHLPLSGFGDFAYAVSVRYPWVRRWTVWNEPNSRTFAVPVSPGAYVRRLLNPAYVSLHAASGGNQVAG